MPRYKYKNIEEFRIHHGLANAYLNASYNTTIVHDSEIHIRRKARNLNDNELCKKYFLDGKSVRECWLATKINTYKIRRYYKKFNKKYKQL